KRSASSGGGDNVDCGPWRGQQARVPCCLGGWRRSASGAGDHHQPTDRCEIPVVGQCSNAEDRGSGQPRRIAAVHALSLARLIRCLPTQLSRRCGGENTPVAGEETCVFAADTVLTSTL